jgi:FAD/FMN-containing dehydrogenase
LTNIFLRTIYPETRIGMSDFTNILNELRAHLSGRIVDRSHESYESARKVWNTAVLHLPPMIAYCESTSDVQAAVRVARRHSLPISVRGGGHDWAGRALCPEGLVIDLTAMSQVCINSKSRIATVGGGAKLRDLAMEADTHGLVAAVGNCGAVGVAGLTTVGGYGPLNGLYGLAADNLLAAEVVLADGRCVVASPNHEADLFWAIRGGGGNFGVVVSLQIRLHEKRHMLGGSVVYAWTEAKSVLGRYAAFASAAPDELGIPVSTMSGPDGQPTLFILPLWNGDKHPGEQIMHELQTFGTSSVAQVGPTTYSDMLAQFDAAVDAVSGLYWEARTCSLPAPLATRALDAIVAAVSHRTSPYSMVNWHHCHGATTRVLPEATAFGLREEHFMVEIFAGWRPDEDGAPHKQWARDLREQLAPLSLPASYPAYLTSSDREQAAHAYGNNADQLRSVKRRYDPDCVFFSAVPLPSDSAD